MSTMSALCGWIPCHAALPAPGERVIVHAIEGERQRVGEGFRGHDFSWRILSSVGSPVVVACLAWMPFPEAPEYNRQPVGIRKAEEAASLEAEIQPKRN